MAECSQAQPADAVPSCSLESHCDRRRRSSGCRGSFWPPGEGEQQLSAPKRRGWQRYAALGSAGSVHHPHWQSRRQNQSRNLSHPTAWACGRPTATAKSLRQLPLAVLELLKILERQLEAEAEAEVQQLQLLQMAHLQLQPLRRCAAALRLSALLVGVASQAQPQLRCLTPSQPIGSHEQLLH